MTIERPYICTGYDVSLPIQLYVVDASGNRQKFVISPTATVKVALITQDRCFLLIPSTVSSSGATGADWPNSLIVAEFTQEQTSKIEQYGDAFLEVSVNDGTRLPWFVSVVVVKGFISG